MFKSIYISIVPSNQRFENAGVAFVRETNEINEFFEKINKQ